MSWLRVDDGFVDHPKLVSLGGPAQRWAYLELLAYCARHRTDGYFPEAISDTLRRVTPALLDRCITVGLVDRSDHDGELRIHDWDAYNPAKDATGAVRQQRWRNANRNGSVTENVTGDITPRAQARPRDTVPSRPVTALGTSERSSSTDDEEARPPTREDDFGTPNTVDFSDFGQAAPQPIGAITAAALAAVPRQPR